MHFKSFNPIATARQIEKSYRDYIATTIHFDDADLQRQLEGLLGEHGYLSKGPYLEAAPPYVASLTPRQLTDRGLLCPSMLSLGGGDPKNFDPDRPLYEHQMRAIEKAHAGRNFAVVTGTGSGKTECFLLPILNDILQEFDSEGPSSGVRALILYPMNALANDQLKRLRQLLAGTKITFGRYTGDTRETQIDAVNAWLKENPGQKRLPNEIISREEIRKNPPNILLTNYSMLEYLLLRPEDAPLFSHAFGSKWRHIAIDEAHVYSGALGTEIAYLLRRLKARIASQVGQAPQLHCYATSATIGSEKDMPRVAKFAQDLFGEPFAQEGDLDVITSAKDDPRRDLRASWGRLPLGVWRKLHALLLQDGQDVSAEDLRRLLKGHVSPQELITLAKTENALLGLGQLLLGEESTATLVRRMARGLMSLSSLTEIEKIGITGLTPDSDGITNLSAMVDVLSMAQRSEGVPILSSRYHSFLRAPEGLYLNLYTWRLSTSKHLEEDCGFADGLVPVYEVSVCRHCGQAYVLGNQQYGTENKPAWLNPRHEGTDEDDEFLPRTYYRLLHNGDSADEEEQCQWLCPICGALHASKEGGAHRFAHPDVDLIPIALGHATEDDAKCGHCGYRSKVAIQPMRVSPEAAGSVVCYDLVRAIPPFDVDKSDGSEDDNFDFGDAEFDIDLDAFEDEDEEARHRAGSVICFSDRRQDAAFFAPAMERTYGSITRRQIIREAVEAKSSGEAGCTPESVEAWIASVVPERYPGVMQSNPMDQATAWVIDELTSEDSRNSLGGLGVVRVLPTPFLRMLDTAQFQKIISRALGSLKGEQFSCLGPADYALLATMCLETLRERNAISVPEGVDQYRVDADIRRQRAKGMMVVPDVAKEATDIRFVGSAVTTENKRSDFIRRYMMRNYGVELSREDACTMLRNLYQFLLMVFKGLGKKGFKAISNNAKRYSLNRNLWTFYPHADDDTVYVCDTCGCMSCMDTRGVCTTSHCQGTMVAKSFAECYSKDRFYKEVYGSEALPITIEEHTAQLSPEKAREIQAQFLKGEVQVLSCTTTFELGVDVGDLRAIFMRNVPPTTANYTQRAGRVGRRAGMPGYAVTFARLRPHDVKFFEDPATMICGETRVPMCYLNNVSIARRHVHAIALSEFFRLPENASTMRAYHDFMDLSQEIPPTIARLEAFIDARPQQLMQQLSYVAQASQSVAQELGMETLGWTQGLLGTGQTSEVQMGRLVRTHMIKHMDYMRVEEGIAAAHAEGDDNTEYRLVKTRSSLKSESTIAVLADGGVLPKYGFPTDLVDLHLPVSSTLRQEGRLRLQRGMRQAIREYAPGAEIVAGKAVWKSIGIKRSKAQDLIVRSYGECPKCHAFAWPIDNYTEEYDCPVCGTRFKLGRKMLIPSFGFVGKEVKKGVGLRRPRSRGYANVFFSQHWPDDWKDAKAHFDGGTIDARFAGNGELCIVNQAKRVNAHGFQVCSYCYAAATVGEKIEHHGYCAKLTNAPFIKYYDALGASFTSDVLELVFSFDAEPLVEPEAWESVMWALFAAASRILEVPETELGGTQYTDAKGRHAIMLYDDVPGGAGHTKQLFDEIDTLVRLAYDIVASCSCGEETCCYGCIANYFNQGRQAHLSRGAAKQVLGALLFSREEPETDTREQVRADKSARVYADFSVDLSGDGFDGACRYALRLCQNDEERSFVEKLADLGAGTYLECPQSEVTFMDENDEEADAMLAWEDARILLLGKASLEEFEEAGIPYVLEGWRTFILSDSAPGDIIEALMEE